MGCSEGFGQARPSAASAESVMLLESAPAAMLAKEVLFAGGGGSGGVVMPVLILLPALLILLLLGRRARRVYRELVHMQKVSADIPGPPTMPLIGNLLDVVVGGEKRIYENCRRLMENYGSTFRVWLGPELVIALAHPDDVEFVTTSNELSDKSGFYAALEPLLGRGLSTMGGQEVKRHRKIVSPSLHLDILHHFVDTFSREALRFATHLEPFAESGQEFDVSPLCVEYSLAAALQTIMSTELEAGGAAGDAGDAERRAFGDVLQSAMDLFMYRIWRPWFLNDTLFRLSGRRGEYLDVMTKVNGFTEAVIAEKRRQLSTRGRHPPDTSDVARRQRRKAFLDNVLDSEEGAAMSDTELRDETKTLLCTASETSASTLNFVLMVLSLRQDVQDLVVKELEDVFGEDGDRTVTLEELPHLHYLERVIKETLRLFPVLPFFTRRCPRDVQLPSGYTAPRGCHLTLALPALHTNATCWTNPHSFDPDRFLPERSRHRHPFSYLPFSAGPRNCVGQRYAMMLLKVELATLVRRFRILPPSSQAALDIVDVPIKVALVIAVQGGVRIRVQRREWSSGARSSRDGSP